MKAIKYLEAPADWLPEEDNPFTQDGRYGPEWICFYIHRKGDNPADFCGSGKNSLYTCRIDYSSANSMRRLADFLRYENRHGRNVILSFPDEMDVDTIVNEALIRTPTQDVVREEDPKWVVHSTNLEAWDSIQYDDRLKALSILLKEGRDVITVGFQQLGEPPDYAEYVMLGKIEGIGSEYVVASQQKERVFTEGDTHYEPGVRLYFDNHKIIKSGLGVRDGVHLMKVYHYLPLTPFLLTAVSVRNVDPKGDIAEWTPNTFWPAANSEFYRRIGEYD